MDRVVVTDGIDSVFKKKNLEVKLISLEKFLTKNN